MKICLITEIFQPKTGGQYTCIKGIANQLDVNKINYLIIHKDSPVYKNKPLLDKELNSSDIFHFFGGWTFFYIKMHLKALKLNKKIIIHPLGLFEPWALGQKKFKKKIAWNLYQKKLLLKSDLIHCASINESKNLKKLDKRFKTVILPFGVENIFLKKKNNLKLNNKAIFFSRLLESKGLKNLINAWKVIGNKYWTLDIIGDGIDKNFFKKMITNNNNINLFKPIYNKEKKKQLFQNYDFFVLPTYNESFGLAILESLSYGLPVLTTRNTPWSNIKKYNAGWIINNSYDELIITLNKIFKLKSYEFNIKSKNSIKLASKFRWSVIFNQYIKTYKDLLK